MSTYNFEEMFTFERKYLNEGKKYIAGIDEVGRGPLAGPVVVASVIMPLEKDKLIYGINDSKKLSEKKRNYFCEQILDVALDYHISTVDNLEIDKINILNATKKGMIESSERLKIQPDLLLVDAVKTDFRIPFVSIIKGDEKSYSIAAASIIAKVYRDRLMESYDEKFPQFNFKKNKGYGTKEHINALKEYGCCEIHRKTFIKNFV